MSRSLAYLTQLARCGARFTFTMNTFHGLSSFESNLAALEVMLGGTVKGALPNGAQPEEEDAAAAALAWPYDEAADAAAAEAAPALPELAADAAAEAWQHKRGKDEEGVLRKDEIKVSDKTQ